MFINTLNPTLLKLGIFEIRWYGLVYVLGFIIVYWMLYRKRKELKITVQQIDNLIIAIFIGLLVGARIFNFLFEEPSIFIRDPLEILKIWHGGMSFFGALFGMFIASFYYIKKIKLDWKKFADIIVIAGTIALIFGRIANFINGELVGIPSNLPWCVIFPYIDNICRHPYQIYASISHIILLGFLLFVNKIKDRKDGAVFFTFVIGYPILRFLTDFFREDPRFFGLTVWQYLSVFTFFIGCWFASKHKIYNITEKINNKVK